MQHEVAIINEETFINDENKNLEVLDNYFREYVIENKVHKISKTEIAVGVVAALFGAAWGAPWTQAASQAAIIFPGNLTRKVFEEVFAAGIVITLAGDGLWVMLEIGKDIGSKSSKEALLTKKTDNRIIKISKIAFPALFSLFACISAVYATIKYNSGPGKFLGIITFICNYGLGFYGYHKLLETAFDQIHLRNSIKLYTNALAVKENILRKIDFVLAGRKEFSNDEELMEFILGFNDAYNLAKSEKNFLPYVRQIFQVIPTALISISASLIGIMLTKEFLQKSIYNQPAFAYSAAIFSEIPGFVVGIISNYDIFGRVFDLLFCSSNNDQSNLVHKMYPTTNIVMLISILAISLTAPTAGAYVTYKTLEDFAPSIQWIATVSIIAARLIFSNFTLNKLSKSLLQTVYEKTHPSDDSLSKMGRLIEFKNIVNNTNLTFFKQPNNKVNMTVNSIKAEETSFLPVIEEIKDERKVPRADRVPSCGIL